MRINTFNINKTYVIFERNETGESQRYPRASHYIVQLVAMVQFLDAISHAEELQNNQLALHIEFASHTHGYVRALFPHSSEHADGCLLALSSLLHALEKRKYCVGREGLFLDFDSQFILQVVHFRVKKKFIKRRLYVNCFKV